MCVLCTLIDTTHTFLYGYSRTQAIIFPGQVPWVYTMGWMRGAALPGPLAALWLGDVS